MSTLPKGYTQYSVSNNGNTVTFARPGHSTLTPKLLIVKRSVPEFANGRWSTPQYSLKLVRGLVDANGAPVTPRINVGTEGIRWPMSGVGVQTAVSEEIAEFAAVMSTVGLAADIFALVVPNQGPAA